MEPAKRIIRTLAIAALFFVIGFVWPAARKHDMSGFKALDGKLEVSFINVGNGDCALLMCGGEAMLIDAGGADAGDDVCAYLDAKGVRTLKYAVGSQNRSEHIGGMSDVLRHCKAEMLYLSPTHNENADYDIMLDTARELGVPVTEVGAPPDIKLELGGASVEFIGPYGPYMDPSEASLVMLVKYGGASFLFTGDMGTRSEHEMLDYRMLPKDITVLKVAKHGSDDSSCFSFLTQVNPIYAVISCGENANGWPGSDTLLRLDQSCEHTYRIDRHGTVVILTDGAEVTVSTDNEYPDRLQSALAYEAGRKES